MPLNIKQDMFGSKKDAEIKKVEIPMDFKKDLWSGWSSIKAQPQSKAMPQSKQVFMPWETEYSLPKKESDFGDITSLGDPWSLDDKLPDLRHQIDSPELWSLKDPMTGQEESKEKEPEWLSPFADIDKEPLDDTLQEGQSLSDEKKKYFVVDAGEEMTILCHAPNPKSPESALRDALREIEDLKYRLGD